MPAFENEFGKEGDAFFSVRQTRFGVKTLDADVDGRPQDPSSSGKCSASASTQGQTTIRLRHAYGELGKWGAGQYWSPFMDIDVFPNTLEYWGPNGMAFFRNVQVRYMPIQGDTRMTIALERPGASGDAGRHANKSSARRASSRASRCRICPPSTAWRSAVGYVEVAGIVRRIEWDDLNAVRPRASTSPAMPPAGASTLSSNLKARTERPCCVSRSCYGEGIENYMNDAPVDVGAKSDADNPSSLPSRAWRCR